MSRPMMDVMTVISEWYRIADEQRPDDPFFQFIGIWIAFNAFYVSRYHNFTDARVSDHKCVRKFAQEAGSVAYHRRLLKDAEYARAVAVLAEEGVRDVISDEHYEIPKPEDLAAVLEVVYQVRCNLFHGGKLIRDPRDQRLTRASFMIIKHLLQPIIA
jgi:hypothetical protein